MLGFKWVDSNLCSWLGHLVNIITEWNTYTLISFAITCTAFADSILSGVEEWTPVLALLNTQVLLDESQFTQAISSSTHFIWTQCSQSWKWEFRFRVTNCMTTQLSSTEPTIRSRFTVGDTQTAWITLKVCQWSCGAVSTCSYFRGAGF